ncbi:hypothetical protein MLD38_019611 [Melastoma candidum]|uniref:Uncharacterized protein n=1 Tax=Melastoma candidum TaxID=119954 RepID=A0ACB9QZE6_9MYRT|nr:hypothetical protein MLD38_019611 [Melastoma candidum]
MSTCWRFPLNLGYLEAEFFLYGSTGLLSRKSVTSGDPENCQGISKALLTLSAEVFTTIMDDGFGRTLVPPFDPCVNSINYLLASYMIPYVGLTGYVGANPRLQGTYSKKLVAGLLGMESGQDAVIRALLYQRADKPVEPYGITVAKFTEHISKLRNKLSNGGLKDEGLVVPRRQGAEGSVSGNILAGDENSVTYEPTAEEILSIVYGSGK